MLNTRALTRPSPSDYNLRTSVGLGMMHGDSAYYHNSLPKPPVPSAKGSRRTLLSNATPGLNMDKPVNLLSNATPGLKGGISTLPPTPYSVKPMINALIDNPYRPYKLTDAPPPSQINPIGTA